MLLTGLVQPAWGSPLEPWPVMAQSSPRWLNCPPNFTMSLKSVMSPFAILIIIVNTVIRRNTQDSRGLDSETPTFDPPHPPVKGDPSCCSSRGLTVWPLTP